MKSSLGWFSKTFLSTNNKGPAGLFFVDPSEVFMERHLYRFRRADRLLGKDATESQAAVPGELEKLEIYFAPPEQLNDPLEGYREIYWSGDRIAWINLFRHYLLVLAYRSWQIDDVQLGVNLPKELPTWLYPSKLEDICLAAFQEMDTLLREDEVFQGYAIAFAKDENKHYKPQLLHYLIGLHSRFLSIVLTVNERHKMTSVRQSEPPFRHDLDAEYHLRPIGEIERYGGVGQKFDTYRQVALSVSAFDIKTFNLMPKEIPLRELFELFAGQYLDGIEVLMHPRWYVACFMKECDNSAIWGSYGDNHKAICLKYRVSEQENDFSLEINRPVGTGSGGIEFGFQGMHFKEVFYNRDHSEIDFFRSLENVPNEALGGFWYNDGYDELSTTSEWFKTDSSERRDEHWKRFYFALTSKLPQWESEKEYRLVLNSCMDISEKKYRALGYRFSSLEGIIFGIKTPLEHKLKAIRIIKAHCENEGRENFNFYQAYYNPETKSIQHALLPVSIDDVGI
ncbi:hypothetical protein AO070_17165 [Pseudomonas syringae pv. syringae PD2766]|uniref:DUF2971 domain-containing protein n=1 Tax=Pseudomonas syringae TaxID=317 RepID=UPI000736A019|nr:DUF2971 domain-containing protein [Pseudomonas syringae]KTB77300.1 hypothetical protein AO070_17165 [Pseudomonas syringae pv. syringae PD2766]